MENQGVKISMRCVQQPEVNIPDLVQKLLGRALTKICQDYVKFVGFVQVTGSLKLNIDNSKYAMVTIDESVKHAEMNTCISSRFDSRENLQPLVRTVFVDGNPGEALPQDNEGSDNCGESIEKGYSKTETTGSLLNDKLRETDIGFNNLCDNPLFGLTLEDSVENNQQVQNCLENLVKESQKYFHHVNGKKMNESTANLPSVEIINDSSSTKENFEAINIRDVFQNGNNSNENKAVHINDKNDFHTGTENDDESGDDILLTELIQDANNDTDVESPHESIATKSPSRRLLRSFTKKHKFGDAKKSAKDTYLHPCPECKRLFSSATRLQTHLKQHKLKYNCSECDKVFSKRIHLKKHLKNEHDMTTFTCDLCYKLFSCLSDLQSHVQDVHNHICSICGESFTKVNGLRKHRQAFHAKEVVECSVCGKTCCSVRALRKHEKRHSNLSYTCDICGKVFTAQSTLYHHKRGVHSNEKPYKCKQCDKSFNFHHSLKLHILHHKGTRPHQCPHCNKSYLTATHLKSHVNAIHNPKRFCCVTCGKIFPYESSLKMHMMLHNGERPFACDECNSRFVSKSALKAHEKTAHTTGKLYQCGVCQKTYKTEGLLRAHERRHTDAGSRFMCDICGHTFMYKSNLDAHIVTHGEERRYKCNVCDKSFKTNATLYSHQLVHKKEKSTDCCICGKEFKSKERLAAHEKRHSGLKPFNCEICHRSFPDKGGLTKHTKTVHSNYKRFACLVCGKTCSRSDNLRVHMKSHNIANQQNANSLIKKIDSPSQMEVVNQMTQKQNNMPKPGNITCTNNITSETVVQVTGPSVVEQNNCQMTSGLSVLPSSLPAVNSLPQSLPQLSTVPSSLMNSVTCNENNLMNHSVMTSQMSAMNQHHNHLTFNDRMAPLLNQTTNIHNTHNLPSNSGDNPLSLNSVVLPLMNQAQNQAQQGVPEHDFVTAANSVLYMQYNPYFGNFPY